MKKILLTSLIFCIILPNIARSETNLAGRILLQVEDKGQAWYVYPTDGKRYNMGRPTDAFNLMRKLGIGISNKDLVKIPIGFSSNNYLDSDVDGLYDNLEDAIGTDKNNKDTDSDGYDDKTEINNNYDPLNKNKLPVDQKLTQINSGKIFLQIEKNGEAWYVEPITQKRYFLGRPDDAFQIMRTFGLGITNSDLEKIAVGILPGSSTPTTPPPTPTTPTKTVLQSAATAIREINTQKTLAYFSSDMHKSIEYSMANMTSESLLMLANILSSSTLESSTENKRTYKNEVYFQGEKHIVRFYTEKQPDGTWLMTNL
ncbi:MAG: hypothetical protein WC349_04660 [Patescibacteria group bacterium]|jgi:hypothetical protein